MATHSGPPAALDQAVDGLIAAGCHAQALALPAQFVARGSRHTCSELLVQIEAPAREAVDVKRNSDEELDI